MTAPVPPAPDTPADPFAPFGVGADQIKALLATDPRAALRLYGELQGKRFKETGFVDESLNRAVGMTEAEGTDPNENRVGRDWLRAAGFGNAYEGQQGLYDLLASDRTLTTPEQLAQAEAAQGASVRERYAALQAAEDAARDAQAAGPQAVDGPLSGEEAFAIANSRDGLNALQKRIQALPRGDAFRDAFLSGKVTFNPETRRFEGDPGVMGPTAQATALSTAQAAYQNKAANDIRTYLPSAAMTAPAVNQNLADDPFSAFGQTGPAQTKVGAIGTLSPSVAGSMAGGAIQPDGGAGMPSGELVGPSALAPVNEPSVLKMANDTLSPMAGGFQPSVLKMAPPDPFPYAEDPTDLPVPQNPTPSEPVPGTPSGGPIGGPGGGPGNPDTPVPGGTKPYPGGPPVDIPAPPKTPGTRPYTGPQGVIPMGNAFGRPQSPGRNPSGGMGDGGNLSGLNAIARKRSGAPMRNNAPGRPYGAIPTTVAPDFRKVGKRPMGPSAPTFPTT